MITSFISFISSSVKDIIREHPNRILQKELCWEAMRLGVLLTEYEGTNGPKTNALMALMCFHSSRFNARQPGEDDVILYDQQDERLWDYDLIRRGMQYLTLSATGDQLSSYHLEARIASWHCIKEDTPEKWEEILQLYNQLLMINYSPGVALNRTFALYKANGSEAALIELEKLKLDGQSFLSGAPGLPQKTSPTLTAIPCDPCSPKP